MALAHGTLVASMHLPQVNTMRVAFPDPDAGSPLCSASYLTASLVTMEQVAAETSGEAAGSRGGSRSGSRGGTPPEQRRRGRRPHSVDNLQHAMAGGLVLLESRVPVWNQRTESYVLNFHGRATLASSKNLQLVPWQYVAPPSSPLNDATDNDSGAKRSNSTKRMPTLLYGKVDKDTYNLDYQHPLSAYHAFLIAVSVADW